MDQLNDQGRVHTPPPAQHSACGTSREFEISSQSNQMQPFVEGLTDGQSDSACDLQQEKAPPVGQAGGSPPLNTPGPVDQGSACGTSRERRTSPPQEAHKDQKGPPQTDGGTPTQRRGQPQNPTSACGRLSRLHQTRRNSQEWIDLLVCPPRPDSIFWTTNSWSPWDSELDPCGMEGEKPPRVALRHH